MLGFVVTLLEVSYLTLGGWSLKMTYVTTWVMFRDIWQASPFNPLAYTNACHAF